MKKRYVLALILGVLLIPMVFRTVFPNLYIRIWTNYPFFGILLVIALDIIWMWLLLFVLMLIARLIRRLRG